MSVIGFRKCYYCSSCPGLFTPWESKPYIISSWSDENLSFKKLHRIYLYRESYRPWKLEYRRAVSFWSYKCLDYTTESNWISPSHQRDIDQSLGSASSSHSFHPPASYPRPCKDLYVLFSRCLFSRESCTSLPSTPPPFLPHLFPLPFPNTVLAPSQTSSSTPVRP